MGNEEIQTANISSGGTPLHAAAASGNLQAKRPQTALVLFAKGTLRGARTATPLSGLAVTNSWHH